MKTTTNIPKSLPINTDPKTEAEIKTWMSQQPEHDLDTCINSSCRWIYKVVDHGVWSDITVIDGPLKTEFKPEVDIDSW